MPTIKNHKQGTPSWVDLSTTDQPAAKRFYGSLLGWTWKDEDMGNGEFYSMAQLKGKSAAAVFTQRADEKQMGIPPHWTTYITVDNVDATTAKVPGAGGKVLMESFDVFDSGRMSVIADPTGGIVSLWQAKSHIGAEIMNEPGSLTWSELFTDDVKKASDFFAKVLGVKILRQEQPFPYTMMQVDGKDVGGFMQKTPEMGPMPSFWALYFAVADCDSTCKKAESLGGKVLVPPMTTPPGRFATLQDPQGAMFAVIKLNRQYS
jgi:predicted enzyme related to lactoylglutathione lyase